MLLYKLISIIAARCGIIVASKVNWKKFKIVLLYRVNTGTTGLNWKPVEERRKYLKSIFIYKILNAHTAPNLKEAFQFKNERDIAYSLGSRETDLALYICLKTNSARGALVIIVPRIIKQSSL